MHGSPHRLAGVVGLAVLAQHHLGLVLQGLHMLRILQAPRFWREAAAVSFSLSPSVPLTVSQGLRRREPSPAAIHPLLPPGKKFAHICIYVGPWRESERQKEVTRSPLLHPQPLSSKAWAKTQLPGLKRTRAFMQANSVGSTASARNLEMVSCRIRVSALASASRP